MTTIYSGNMCLIPDSKCEIFKDRILFFIYYANSVNLVRQSRCEHSDNTFS